MIALPAWLLGLSHLGGLVGTGAELALLASGNYAIAAVAIGPLVLLAVVVVRAGVLPRSPRGHGGVAGR